MCRPASFVATPSRVYYSRLGDSHRQILKEQGICDGWHTDDFVKIEVCPPAGDYNCPLSHWLFSFDVGVPCWAAAIRENLEVECRALLPEWAVWHFLIPEGDNEVKEGMTRIARPGVLRVKQTGGQLLITAGASPIVEMTGGCCYAMRDSFPTVQKLCRGDVCDESGFCIYRGQRRVKMKLRDGSLTFVL